MPICSYRRMTWGRFIPLKPRLQSHVPFLQKWFCEKAVLSLSDFAVHLAVQVTRGTILMPLILRHPLGCFCIHLKILAIATKLLPGAPHCGTARCHCHPMNRGHCAATIKICLLLHTVKLYHGEVIKWAVINYVLSWKREFKVYWFRFQIHSYL